MPEGGRIKISANNIYLDSTFTQMNPEAKAGNYISLTISDTGSGIPKNIIDKIFEPFFTTKGIGKGTGLGLSTTIGIIKSHGGFINVTSNEGLGTEFKIYLPVTGITENEFINKKSEQIFKGNGETILIIENDNSILEAAIQTLEQHNYKVIKASDGVEGVAAYLQNKEEIKLVISNVTLPIMDGYQTIKVIFKMNPDEKIILISGLEQRENIRQYDKPIKFIKKPFTANILLMAIHEQFNN
jgi:two-component system cell cycle sensor histidine kinase/response regulator CckA